MSESNRPAGEEEQYERPTAQDHENAWIRRMIADHQEAAYRACLA